MTGRNALKQKIHDAPHMSKPDEADFVFYDANGRWVFEMYTPSGSAKQALPEHVEEKSNV